MANDPAGTGDRGDERPGETESRGALPDMVRRMLALGLSGFFTTEETLRRALGDTVPQEWVDFAASQSEKTQREFSDAMAREVGRVLEQVDLGDVLGQVLENRSLEIHARVRLLPSDETGETTAELGRVTVSLGDAGRT